MAVPTLIETVAARDRGLVRGIGTVGLAGSVVNTVVGSGIFTLPAAVVLLAGGAAPLAFLASAVIVAGVVVCFAESGSRLPTSGGAYGTVEAAFGPAAASITGITFLASNVLSDSGVAAALADSSGTVLPGLAHGPGRVALLACLYGALAAANLLGVRLLARGLAVIAAVKLVPLLGFMLLGLAAQAHPAPAGPATSALTGIGFARAVVLTIFAFSGFETALLNSGEIRAPGRTLPRALFLAMLLILVVYLGVQLSAQHLLGGRLAFSAAPLADAASRVSPALGGGMLAAATIAMLGFLAGDVLGSSRLVLAFGRDGLMSGWFGGIHASTGVPARAVLAYTASAFVLAATGSFLELVFLSGMTTVVVYGFTCAAGVVLARRGVALAGPPLEFPGLPWAAAIGLCGVAVLAVSARPIELGGLGLLIAASLALHAARGWRRRRLAAAV